MLENIILLFLEKICEAIYFSLFLIYGKNLKEKRLLLIGIMIFEYILLTSIFLYSIWIHIIYITLTYINLKFLYKDKAQITDIFLFAMASIILIFFSLICGLLQFNLGFSHFSMLVLNRILIFVFLFIFKNKINKIYKSYYSKWNRHNDKTKIRSLTLRNISVIIFNLMFYIINIGLIYAILFIKRGD